MYTLASFPFRQSSGSGGNVRCSVVRICVCVYVCVSESGHSANLFSFIQQKAEKSSPFMLEFVRVLIVAVVSVVGKHLWHNAIDLIKVSFGRPQRTVCSHSTQAKTIDLIKIPFECGDVLIIWCRSQIFLTVRFVGCFVEIMLDIAGKGIDLANDTGLNDV